MYVVRRIWWTDNIKPTHKFRGGVSKILTSSWILFLPINKIYIFQCMGKIFCVEFQRAPLKFHTKFLTHTLKDAIFIQRSCYIILHESCDCPSATTTKTVQQKDLHNDRSSAQYASYLEDILIRYNRHEDHKSIMTTSWAYTTPLTSRGRGH